MEKSDLTIHNDSALSDEFMNNEFLYSVLCEATNFQAVKYHADQHFIYDTAQLIELEETYNEQ